MSPRHLTRTTYLPGSLAGTLYPYDPTDASAVYAPLPYDFTVPGTSSSLIGGEGTQGLSVVQVFDAQRMLPPSPPGLPPPSVPPPP
jgi:hypothetical protein